MSKPTHAPEPWSLEKGLITGADGLLLTSRMDANAARIIDCVNAMEGIDDPSNLRATWDAIKELELDKYIELKKVIVDVIKLIDEGRELHPTSIIVEALRHAIK
jgi:hypothetical protein